MPRTDDPQTAGELVPVKFSRLTRRGVLLGLSLAQLITLATGVLSVVGALYAGGGILLAYTAPIWVIAAALTWIPVAGRPAVEWLPVACWWLWRTTGGQLLYRRHVVKPRPVGTLALPGDMARLREYTDPETNAGMIHDPTAATLTVVCEVTHPAFVLLDPGEQAAVDLEVLDGEVHQVAVGGPGELLLQRGVRADDQNLAHVSSPCSSVCRSARARRRRCACRPRRCSPAPG